MGGWGGGCPCRWGFSHVKIGGLGSSLKKKKFPALKSASQVAIHNGSTDLYLLFSLLCYNFLKCCLNVFPVRNKYD